MKKNILVTSKSFIVLKTFIAILLIGISTSFLTGCSSNSPRGVAEKAQKCAKNLDFEGMADCMGLTGSTRENFINMYESHKDNFSEEDRIKSYEFISEEIEEIGRYAGKQAVVTFDITTVGGDTYKEQCLMEKRDDGKWYFVMSRQSR